MDNDQELISNLAAHVELAIDFTSDCPNLDRLSKELKSAKKLLQSQKEASIFRRLREITALLYDCAELAVETGCPFLAADLKAAAASAHDFA